MRFPLNQHKLSEHTEYRWATLEEANELLKFKHEKETLKKADEFLGNIMLSDIVHDGVKISSSDGKNPKDFEFPVRYL